MITQMHCVHLETPHSGRSSMNMDVVNACILNSPLRSQKKMGVLVTSGTSQIQVIRALNYHS